jgi:NADH dehydrogenase (ubiquinone) 1 alpha/beta subcomplex 1
MTPASRMAPAAFRLYSSAGLSQSDIETRVLDILRGFDKVDANKVMNIYELLRC